MEIPGFYRDPLSGKYYGINEKDPYFSSFLQKNKSNVEKVTVSSKPQQILNLLHGRETGMEKYLQFENSFLKLKLEKLNGFKMMKEPVSHSSIDITYLKGGTGRMLGMWRDKDSITRLGEVSHVTVPNLNFSASRLPPGFNDLCDGWVDSNCVMVLYNHIGTRYGIVEYYSSSFHSIISCNKAQCALFCCSSNAVKQQFVSGGENLIMFDTIGRHLYQIKVKGNVQSLQFNEEGAVVYCGVHYGKLLTIDSRQSRYSKKKLFNYGLDEILLLSNNHDLICGSFDGELCKLDLRMMKKVTEYYGHVHTPNKVPFSVDETLNVLCATGSDNVSRLWSLDGGNYIQTVEPPLKQVPHRSWLVGDDYPRKLCIVQQDRTYYIDF